MHARHRSPGNGYRSNSMGMAVAASRISPEGSIRGHGLYNSEYRNFNRGFGRGQPKTYQSPQLPRKADIFWEAGRLATEYLVSKGLLPHNLLPIKWQNGSFKGQVGDFQEFRPQEGENMHLALEGRTSVLARLGNAVSDASPTRRRFSDEYNQTGVRNNMRGRRRMGSFRNFSSDSSRENGRSGSWSDKARASPDIEGPDDSVSMHQEEQHVGDNVGGEVEKFHPSEVELKTDDMSNSESLSEKHQFTDDMNSKTSSSGSEKDLPLEIDGVLSKDSKDLRSLKAGTGEVSDCSGNVETGRESATGNLPIQNVAMDDDSVSKNGTDLLRFCKFANVPTKTRSSLAYRGSKVDPVLVPEMGNIADVESSGGSGIPVEDVKVDCSSVNVPPDHGSLGDLLSNQTQISEGLNSDIAKASSIESAEDGGEPVPTYAVEQAKGMTSQSFPDRAFTYERKSSQGLPGFGRCSSVVKERGEKRAVQHSNMGQESKKPKEWLPSMVTLTDDYFRLSNLNEKLPNSQEERASPVEEAIVAVDQKGVADISLFPKHGGETCVDYAEEKQLLPSSFKICDLNLMEASDMNENRDSDPHLIFPSISENKKEAALVDIDLSISNNCNISKEYGRRPADDKEVEVIDLENDSTEEDKAFNSSERKTETVYSGLESFPNHAQNTSDIPDVQDGYGLMISELLGTDIPNCSSVPADMNSLHNEMSLHNAEGILSDDDPIYMSLGEIPISFLRVWEPPTQEYEKPF